MELDSIKKAIDRGDIPLLHDFINNEKFVKGDPRAFYNILSSAISVDRSSLKLDDVNKIYDDLILQLIKAAKKVHFGLFRGRTLLMRALLNYMSYDIIIELLKAGSDVNATTDYGAPLLLAVSAGNDIKIISELINWGADINYRNYLGWTPLFYGMDHCYNCPDLILLLLNAGSNVHNIDCNGRNILMINSCNCLDGSDCKAKESIDMLLKYGANEIDFNDTDNNGNTVLHETCCKYVFELALKYGVSIEAKNNRGRTPLLKSVNTDDEEKIVYLLKYGVNIHSTDLQLQTVLHVCSLGSCEIASEIVDTLIYHGANVDARNINNQTPLDILVEKNTFDEELAYVILKHIILFDGNGFDIAKKTLIKLDNSRLGLCELSFGRISACEKELKVMRETFMKDGLTFYEFCVLKRYYKSKFVNIAPNEYKYSFSDISKLFPLYRNIIIIRIKDNRLKKRELDFRRVFERIIFHPVNTTETDYSEVLNYDCLYQISQYLNFKEMFYVFNAAIEI